MPQQHTFQLPAAKCLSENFKQPFFSLSHILGLLSKWKELRNTNSIQQGRPLVDHPPVFDPCLIHDTRSSFQYHNLSQWPDWREMRRVKEAFFLSREKAQAGTFPHLSGKDQVPDHSYWMIDFYPPHSLETTSVIRNMKERPMWWLLSLNTWAHSLAQMVERESWLSGLFSDLHTHTIPFFTHHPSYTRHTILRSCHPTLIHMPFHAYTMPSHSYTHAISFSYTCYSILTHMPSTPFFTLMSSHYYTCHHILIHIDR